MIKTHGRPTAYTVWDKGMMDGSAMMGSSCFTLVRGFWFMSSFQLELSYPRDNRPLPAVGYGFLLVYQ